MPGLDGVGIQLYRGRDPMHLEARLCDAVTALPFHQQQMDAGGQIRGDGLLRRADLPGKVRTQGSKPGLRTPRLILDGHH